MYEMLISRPELAAAIIAFPFSLVSHSMADTGTVHLGGLQVLCRYLLLQDVHNSLSGGVWTYTEAELLGNFSILLQQGPTDAYQL